MRIRLFAAAAVIATVGFAAGAQAATLTGLFNTGVDALGNALPNDAPEIHWLVNGSGTPSIYENGAYIVVPDAQFISAGPGGSFTQNPNTYSLTFSLVGLDPASAQLSGSFAADNFASAFLNGHLIAQDVQSGVFSNLNTLTPFSAPGADFVSGLNTLSFVVTDTGPPSALLVDGLSGTADPARGGVPEPSSWAMLLVGFGGLGALMRSRRRMAVASA